MPIPSHAMSDSGRIKLLVAYEGTRYAGWQAQAAGLSHIQPTIQSELEIALEHLVASPVRVHGAGRTDAGVHAEGQVAHFDLPPDLSEGRRNIDWVRALNGRLPEDIRVMEALPVPPSFHSRISATGKLYCYSIWHSSAPVPPGLRRFCWHTPPVDLEVVKKAARALTGRHDFASFKNMGTPVKSTVRTVHSINIFPARAGSFLCPPEWPVVSLFFNGEGFLKQMVRNMAGLLVRVGSGKLPLEEVKHILDNADREKNPCLTAPAQGLTLMQVMYDE